MVARSSTSILIPVHNFYQKQLAPPENSPADCRIGFGAFGVVWKCTDPRTRQQVALKKMPNIFQNYASCKRVFREIRMLSTFDNDNVLCLKEILKPSNAMDFHDLYVITELMESDLHKVIISRNILTMEHIQVFLYQILRGLKYLHSANIIHRDIKPGNLLVNSHCVLKICDFGLARTWDRSNSNLNMSTEVVTQYYRAPELLMGARKYTNAIDIWSVGCIFAELLQRRVLFPADGPVEQLNRIIDLLGTPEPKALNFGCEAAKNHILRAPKRLPQLQCLQDLHPEMNNESAGLLLCMLQFDPTLRWDAKQLLAHPFMEGGRMRFHACMCRCCHTVGDNARTFTTDFEPAHNAPLDPRWEEMLNHLSMFQLREQIYAFVTSMPPRHEIQLTINPESEMYKNYSAPAVPEAEASPHA